MQTIIHSKSFLLYEGLTIIYNLHLKIIKNKLINFFHLTLFFLMAFIALI